MSFARPTNPTIGVPSLSTRTAGTPPFHPTHSLSYRSAGSSLPSTTLMKVRENPSQTLRAFAAIPPTAYPGFALTHIGLPRAVPNCLPNASFSPTR